MNHTYVILKNTGHLISSPTCIWQIIMELPVEHGLLLDNLLDLAHAPFTHTSTFAKGWSVPRFVTLITIIWCNHFLPIWYVWVCGCVYTNLRRMAPAIIFRITYFNSRSWERKHGEHTISLGIRITYTNSVFHFCFTEHLAFTMHICSL